MNNELFINGERVIFDLSPLLELALMTGDKEYFREMWHRNQIYWRYAK
jgi:hypothetical protein